MTELLPFFIVLIAGLFFSEVFKRFHLPWVSALIIAGIVIGPYGAGWFSPDGTILFLSEIGLIFLMFLAGLETRLSTFTHYRTEISWTVALSSIIPFLAGLALGYFFFDNLATGLLLGTVFIASSIAVVIPSLERCGLIDSRFGRTTVGSTIVMDVMALVLLSILLYSASDTAALPLPLFYIVMITAVAFLRFAVVTVWKIADKHLPDSEDLFNEELRILLAILIGTVIVFEIIGLHPVIAGFFAGFILSESIRHKTHEEKLRALGYGLFVPIFFIVVGAQTDISAVFSRDTVAIVLLIAGTAMAAKFISGMIAGRVIGFSRSQRLLLGVATMPHLTTTLAAAIVGKEMGIFPDEIISAILLLVIITSFLSPLLIRYVSTTKHHKKIVKG